jgi:predicted TIM-barrel fold metal-dependent hydrolase
VSQVRRVDCHVHYHPSAVGEGFERHLATTGNQTNFRAPAYRDLGVLTETMQAGGVDLAVLIPNAWLIRALASLGGPMHANTERYNRSLAEDLARYGGGRYVGAAAVDPLGGAEEMAQLERSLALPHLGAIGLLTSYAEDVTLDDPRFEPIWQIAREHDAPVLVHPAGAWPSWHHALRLDTPFLVSGVGFMLGDALAIFRLISAGVFDRYPTLRFMFCQLGGCAPFYCGRWNNHVRNAARRPAGGPARLLNDYLARLWLDTHTQDRHAMALVMAEAGEHTLVLGGDYPVTQPENGIDYALAELDALRLPPATRQKIERDNALTLLGPRTMALLGVEPPATLSEAV